MARKRARKPSERTLFERWWYEVMGTPRVEIRAMRTHNGYTDRNLDYAWLGWRGRAKIA